MSGKKSPIMGAEMTTNPRVDNFLTFYSQSERSTGGFFSKLFGR